MDPMKPIGGLVALGVAAAVVGAAATLGTNGIEETRSVATLAFVALFVVVLAAAGARSQSWLSGEYW